MSTLEYMGKRLDIIAGTSTEVDEFQQAFAHINMAAAKRVPDSHAAVATPSLRRMTSGTSAFTPMVKLRPTKNLDLPESLQDAFRHAGVSYNHTGIESLQDSLISAQFQRHVKLQDHYKTACISGHDSLAERLFQAEGDLKKMSSILYQHTPYQTVSLCSPEIEKQLTSMDRQLQVKDGELLEAEGNELSLSDPKVRAFIAKYGR